MVHIKKVEIFGFKSFGFKNTTVEFRPGLVTISGPNGSGKSNILDAIIFAMGENKPRTMRVDKLRSLIHDIDGQRRGAKMARSSVHFDNADRKIPINADAVEITREMDAGGENTYYINKKKTQRGNVINLMDTANAGLNQLNALQQGTVTRISEFSPEEKRKSIEELVGLSYFDDKKEEAEKQLNEADHRLEIAMTKMGEVKKYIDDLEEARNVYLRHSVLSAEIGRLNAIDAAKSLKSVTAEIAEKRAESAELSGIIREKRDLRDAVRHEIEKVDAEKKSFLGKADAYNNEKARIETSIAGLIQKSKTEGENVAIKTRRIEKIAQRLPEIAHELRLISEESQARKESLKSAAAELERARTRRREIGQRIKDNNAVLAETLRAHTEAIAKITNRESQTKGMNSEKGKMEVAASALEHEVADGDGRSASNHAKRASVAAEIARFEGIHSRLERIIEGHQKSIARLESRIGALRAKRAQIQGDIADLREILEKSQSAAVQYKAKIKMIHSVMHEDYSIARLKDGAHRIGIEGLAFKMVSWDPKYERAALAAGSEWLKAVVTKDITTMVSLAEYARSKNLPKLKIIPLDGASRLDHPGGGDMLADHIRCKDEHRPLVAFLFGGIAVADSAESARRMASEGRRAVTLDGELVEPSSSATVIDTSSKIKELTKVISMSTTVDGLLQSIALLKEYLKRKSGVERRVESAIRGAQRSLTTCESGIATSRNTIGGLSGNIANAKKITERIDEQNAKIASRKEYAVGEIARLRSGMEELKAKIAAVGGGADEEENAATLEKIEALNVAKGALEDESTQAFTEYTGVSSDISRLESELGQREGRGRDLEAEREELLKERSEAEAEVASGREAKAVHEEELVLMREKEQNLIATSGASVSHIEEYDARLEGLRGRERGFERDISSATRKDDAARRDLGDLSAREASLRRIRDTHRVEEDIDDINVRPLLAALRGELDSMSNLNSGAPAKYLEVSDGYRTTSGKKNALESERNKIVSFIESVEKDKKQKFLDAFATVDAEIRHVFTKMTGGNAWLELQNEDDVFSSGISYLIQFPDKPKRESSSISGGEKSLAAIVFVLALQKLNPSPFYLFDEVDAHLDTPNSERLAKILVERAEESQFIAVSLKDSIVKKAKLIYGVYPKNGVSHVLTYKDRQPPIVAS